ncbi:MAG: thioredoxin domain-containing protein [bacterium]
MNKSTLIVIVLAILIGGAGIFLALNQPAKVVLGVNNKDWVKGNLESKVLLEEFSDFECPACKAFEDQVLAALLPQYLDKVKFQYKQYPLTSIHPYALKAAEAAEAAGAQGKFWEMHDKMFAVQNSDGSSLSVDNLKNYAKELGLDTNKFNTELDNSTYKGDVQNSVSEGTSRGVKATPTFYVNGKQISGDTLEAIYNNLKIELDSALASK